MKPSPLLLDAVNYLSASFELLDPSQFTLDGPVPVEVEPQVHFNASGDHFAMVKIRSREDSENVYKVSVEAVAEFGFDLEIATREYRPKIAPALANIIAVNVARIVYASAREYLAVLTSRTPVGPAFIESVLLEPEDVKITSDLSQAELLKALFASSEEEIERYMGVENPLAHP